jgi:hypothetical protein
MRWDRLIGYLLVIFILGFCPPDSLALAKYEPAQGCYLGAYIEQDPVAPGNIYSFETSTQKKHACYLTYCGWGGAFPTKWAEKAKDLGAAIQIGFEPSYGLDSVTDGDYLRKWARDAHASRMPVFVRWASEMNLSEFIWSGDTAKYVEKWRLLYNIFKEEAPNIAMVWAPNWGPTATITSYYPGDEYVDWVGVDMYMGLGTGTTDTRDPRDKISYVYNIYSAAPHNKPIMFPEWAATHAYQNGTTSYTCVDYGIKNTNLIYGRLSTEFPKMKLVTWFDYDSRSINNSDFSITDNYSIITNYQKAVSDPYYLTAIPQDTSLLNIQFKNPTTEQVLVNNTYLSITTYPSFAISSVVYKINNSVYSIETSKDTQPLWDIGTCEDGTYQLRVQGYTLDGKSDYDIVDTIIDKNHDYISIIIDNDQSGFSTSGGGWYLSTSQPDRYGDNYRYHIAGSNATAVWRPVLPSDGEYQVYAWWNTHMNRATNSPYTIVSASGSTTIRVNQEVNGGQWNYLGTYSFTSGNSGYIALSNDADEIVIADAVRFVRNMKSVALSDWALYNP